MPFPLLPWLLPPFSFHNPFDKEETKKQMEKENKRKETKPKKDTKQRKPEKAKTAKKLEL